MRARLALPILVALGSVACGDDGKQGTRGAPAVAPGDATGPTAPAPPTSAPSTPSPGPAGATVPTRVGDWVLWEVKAPGIDARTSLRWTAVAVEATRVRLRIETGTLDVSGATIGARTTESWVALPAVPSATAPAEPIDVKGRAVAARPVTRGEFTAWYAAEVPLGGLARSRGPGGVEQTALDFGRGS